jgi:hypothetical protein
MTDRIMVYAALGTGIGLILIFNLILLFQPAFG